VAGKARSSGMVGGARRRRRVCFATCTRWATAVAVTPWQGEAAGFSGGMDKDVLSRLALVVAFASDNLYTSFSLWSLEALSNDTVIDPPTIKKKCSPPCFRKMPHMVSTEKRQPLFHGGNARGVRFFPQHSSLPGSGQVVGAVLFFERERDVYTELGHFFLNRTTKNSDGNISTARDAAPPRAEDIWLARARASFCALRTQARASAPATRRARAAGMAKGSCKGGQEFLLIVGGALFY